MLTDIILAEIKGMKKDFKNYDKELISKLEADLKAHIDLCASHVRLNNALLKKVDALEQLNDVYKNRIVALEREIKSMKEGCANAFEK